MNLLAFLLAVLIGMVVLYVMHLLLAYMELPDPMRKIVLLIVGLIVLIFALNQLGAIGPAVRVW